MTVPEGPSGSQPASQKPISEMFLEHLTEAKWEVVDAHRCTSCGWLHLNGHVLMEHIWAQHVEYACALRTPASTAGRCFGCGWDGPRAGATVESIDDLHREHRLHSARTRFWSEQR